MRGLDITRTDDGRYNVVLRDNGDCLARGVNERYALGLDREYRRGLPALLVLLGRYDRAWRVVERRTRHCMWP